MESDGTGLHERLQAALGDAYALERELGGGGMARVFVARDARLGRRVVVKVLAPELAEGLSAERFERDVERTIKGSAITRHGSADNPAYLIEQEDGDSVLKLGSELKEA